MKGIIIASFGSIYQDAVEKSIGSIEKKVRAMYSDMEVRRVFLFFHRDYARFRSYGYR